MRVCLEEAGLHTSCQYENVQQSLAVQSQATLEFYRVSSSWPMVGSTEFDHLSG